MRIIRKAFVSLFFTFTLVSALYSYEADKIVSKSIYEQLESSGKIMKSYYKQGDVDLSLVPSTLLAQNLSKNLWPKKNEEPAFVRESLYLVPKSSLKSATGEVSIEEASRVIRRISTMQGIEYYSHNEERYTTLYDNAYCIKGADDRTRVADDVTGSADGKILYALLDDNSFGKTNYRMEYHQNEDEVCMHFINVTPLKFGPVKAVANDNLHILLDISDCGNYFAVYILAKTKFPAFSFLEKTMNESFNARLDAIYDWFCKQFK